MSYSFDYGTPGNNARFVILDNWVTPSKDVAAAGYDYGYSIGDQQSWISSRLDKNTRGTAQAFVFSHQPLIAENHQDSPFIGYTNANPAMQNAFLASLQNNDVKYYICGHDHISQRSIIASPDGKSKRPGDHRRLRQQQVLHAQAADRPQLVRARRSVRPPWPRTCTGSASTSTRSTARA